MNENRTPLEAEYDTFERDMKEMDTKIRNGIAKAHEDNVARVEELMREIEEKINEFVSLTGEKGARFIKPRWRDIKKNRVAK